MATSPSRWNISMNVQQEVMPSHDIISFLCVCLCVCLSARCDHSLCGDGHRAACPAVPRLPWELVFLEVPGNVQERLAPTCCENITTLKDYSNSCFVCVCLLHLSMLDPGSGSSRFQGFGCRHEGLRRVNSTRRCVMFVLSACRQRGNLLIFPPPWNSSGLKVKQDKGHHTPHRGKPVIESAHEHFAAL